MTFPFKHSPFFRRYVGYVYLPGGCPIPTKLLWRPFFLEGSFLNPPNSGDHGPNGLAEKRGAGFWKKPGGVIFGFFGSPLGVISLWCFSRIWCKLGIFGLNGWFCWWLFFGRFLEGILAPILGKDDPIGRIFSWESKGTHPMDDEYDDNSRAQKMMGNIFHWTSCSKRRAADKTM